MWCQRLLKVPSKPQRQQAITHDGSQRNRNYDCCNYYSAQIHTEAQSSLRTAHFNSGSCSGFRGKHLTEEGLEGTCG